MLNMSRILKILIVSDLNSEVIAVPSTQVQDFVNLESTQTQESFVSKITSTMSTNPNYQMLGALGMILLNFSVCVTAANWLKNSSFVS